jgi:hypothetical protein
MVATSWSSCAVISVLVAACAVSAGAQDEAVQPAANPYQEDVSYRIGEELAPNVEVSGVRWLLASVAPRKGEEPAAGQDVTVDVDLRFDNRGRKGTTLLVVLLLEDDDGSHLHRLAIPEMRLSGNRIKEYRHKLTAPGDALLATRRMYLFFRVQ